MSDRTAVTEQTEIHSMRQGYITGGLLALALSGCAISTQQEVQMGAEYATEINKQLPIVGDAEINRYLTLLGDSIARLADDRGLTYRFFLVNSMEVNAFAVPGGFIYVNRGLIERTTNMSQLAGVLGHEIGHVTMRHSVEQMQKAQGTNMAVIIGCTLLRACGTGLEQTAINLTASGLFAKFSRDDERESDREGIKYVIRAGIHPSGIPEMFRILLEEQKTRPSGVETWFMSHPLAEDRVTETERIIAAYDPGILTGLTKDSPNYQAFKRRVAALPVPPPAR
jgi:beta-barrel assembly-enhancing protease